MPEPLKLIASTLPDPERPVLHETTYDLGKDGSKWSHGFIPLNPAAVALKSHKTPGGGGGGGGSAIKRAKRGSQSVAGVKMHDREASEGKPTAAKSDRESRIASARAVLDRSEHDSANPPSSRERDEAKATLRELGSKRQVTVKRDSFTPTRSVEDHVKLAIAHNEAAKRALDRGDTATAERHVAKSREHNAAAISAGEAVLGRNAAARSALEGHAAALAVPIKDRTADQQKAAADALAYAKELRAKRLAAKKAAPPKVKRNTSNGLSTPASIKAARERERTQYNSATHSLGSR